ncbi:hypothetical protein CWI38_1111p0010 [Hamiltosporidium tvaerminnensis]|uniref:VWFA domain-containing protein n=1 Tax=Hamiltosporidium tvaerminnensis TaxID=1176355 RepID=A0A4Q9LT27_9MICR|nr:hypothetical protein CWI38_1111p0010 [Hamiltosporidium tvaerminnensis]
MQMLKYFEILLFCSSLCCSTSNDTSTDNKEYKQIKHITLQFNNLEHFDNIYVFIRDNLSIFSDLIPISPLHVYMCCIESLNVVAWKELVNMKDVFNYTSRNEDVSMEGNYTKIIKLNDDEIPFVKNRDEEYYYTFDSERTDKQERITELANYIHNMYKNLRNFDNMNQNLDSSANDYQKNDVSFEKNLLNKKIIILLSDSEPGIKDTEKIQRFLQDYNEEENNTLIIYIFENTFTKISEKICHEMSGNYLDLYQYRYSTTRLYSNRQIMGNQ